MKKPIQFGKYYLLERVNVGGMAEVFKAKAVGVEGFERLLAVKRILPNIAEDKEFITMFIDEAKIAVQLTHANVAQIFDLGKVDDSYFIALEYVSGKDLRALFDRCKQRPENGSVTMPIAQSAFVIMKVCEGLDYAHNKKDQGGREMHLVHRDMSPQNVLISYEGEVKIIDFGIAKAAGKASKTQAGILKGKFGYMSPEQVRGLPLDRRSDIFAVGICLYELLTGERLFVGESDFSTLEKVRNVEILPPSAYNKKVPEELERIVLKALAKDVDDRYQNAIDLHDDLQAYMYTSGEFFSRKELAASMKRQWHAEIQAEAVRDEEYSRMPTLPSAPAARSKSGSGTVQNSGAGSMAGLRKSQPPAAATVVDPIASSMLEDADDVEESNDLTWDDEELETHVYDAPQDDDDDDEDDTPMPALEDIELSADGAPVPSKRGQMEAAPAGRNGASKGPVEPASRATNAASTMILPPSASGTAGASSGASDDEDVWNAALATARAPVAAQPVPVAAKPAPAPSSRPTPVPSPRPVSIAPAGARPTPASSNKVATPTRANAVAPAAVRQAPPPARPAVDTAAPVLTGPGPRQKKASSLPIAIGGVASVAVACALFLALCNTVGRIEVVISPPDGSRLYVDDQLVPVTELDELKRAPGPHTLTVEHDGYKTWTERIDLRSRGVVKATAVLEMLPRSTLVLRSEPPGATASLDGKLLGGLTPFQASEIIPGKHALEVKLGDRSWSQVVEFVSGRSVELNVALAPTAAPTAPVLGAPPISPTVRPVTPPPPASPVTQPLVAATASAPPTPPRAVVPREPAPPPATPRRRLPSLPASPAVAKADPPPPPVARPEPVAPKATPPAAAPPAAGEGYLRLNSKPWTKIAVDGKDTGLTTPQTHLRLNAGTHKVALSNPQFGITDAFAVEIKAGETETVVKDLRPKTAPAPAPEE